MVTGKAKTQFVCQSCGGVHPKWAGQCEHCGDWNSLAEEARQAGPGKLGKTAGRATTLQPLKAEITPPPRFSTTIPELDRVLGGGLVPGSATLIGGDPGIGKSTLLLQMSCRMAAAGHDIAYFSGEESVDQIRMRAGRIGTSTSDTENRIGLAAATDAADITASMSAPGSADIAIIDSIQTMYLPQIDSSPGTVSQVRASAHALIRAAKQRGIALLLVGHVTKDGAIAGPKVLEHMVDTVLYFEGDRGHHFRILRGIKNRFGPTDEIGVFEMTGSGLSEVANPSELFLADRREQTSGAVVFAGVEGSRPLLVEIQALVAPSSMANPRRTVVGWDHGRLAMIAAVLEARCGIALSGRDIFLNVAGGIRISEPAADLAVAAALISAARDVPWPADTVIFGEVGLAAEIRRVAVAELRLKEAAKLGFQQAIMPFAAKQPKVAGINTQMVSGLAQLVEALGGI